MKVIAVLPAYNEAAVISDVIARLNAFVDRVVVVDDGSSDSTGDLAKRAGAFVVRHLINRGQGAALETGTRLALDFGADVIIHFDADGQHDSKDIAAMIAPITERQMDVVLGSRFLGKAVSFPIGRRLILHLGILFTCFFSGLKLTDVHNGFRAFSRAAAMQISLTHDGMAHASEILDIIADKNLRYVEVPVTIHYTAYSLGRGQGSGNAVQIVWRLLINKFF